MSENGRDFWSDEIIVESVLTPELVLREQAGILAEKTKGIVRGEVETIEQPVENLDRTSNDTPARQPITRGQIQFLTRTSCALSHVVLQMIWFNGWQ